MIKQKIIAFLALSGLQLLGSCICGCADPLTFQLVFNGVRADAFDIIEDERKKLENENSTTTDTFQINIRMDFETIQIGFLEKKQGQNTNISGIYACSCPDDEYIYVDEVVNMQVLVNDTTNDEQFVDVSGYFEVSNHSGGSVPIDELRVLRPTFGIYFLKLIGTDPLPPSAAFKVKVELSSGKTYETLTPAVFFIE